MKICNKKTQSRKKATIKFMTLENRNLSNIGKEMIINLYTRSFLSYLKLLELKSCNGNNI